MNNSTSFRFSLVLVFTLYGFTGPSSAQDFPSLDPLTIAVEGLSAGQGIIDEAPEIIAKLFENGLEGEAFESSMECLGRLQTFTITSAGLANTLPFSQVWTYEDERGPVARLDLMINGLRLNGELFCDNALLKVVPRSFSSEKNMPEPYSPTTFDAALGALLLLQLQGTFDTQVEVEGHIDNSSSQSSLITD